MKKAVRILGTLLVTIVSYAYVAFLFGYAVIGNDYWSRVAYSIMMVGPIAFPLVILTIYADEIYRRRQKREEEKRRAREEAKTEVEDRARV